MKNIKYIILIIALHIAGISNATVRTLNNNNPSPGQYTTWAAVDAASAMNDTVYVSGSPINYGNITITKFGLTIIGTGYHPQKQNPLVSKFGNITGDLGMVRLNGIECGTFKLNPTIGPVIVHVDNCNLIRVDAWASAGYDAQVYLHNNIITGTTGTGTGYSFLTSQGEQLTGEISNNILYGNIGNGTLNPFNLNIFNNLFIGVSSGNSLFNYLSFHLSSVFKNNILMNYNCNTIYSTNPNYTNVIFENNLVYNSTAVLANVSFTMTGTIFANPLFVNVPCTNNANVDCPFNSSYDYQLSALSPGHNAGTDGTDIGPYGGPYGATFNTYGEPSIPQMKQMNMPATVISGQSFNVNIISTVK